MSAIRRGRHTLLRSSLLALSALLVASACAVIPSSGPVTKVADDKGLGESTVRYSPARPSRGASPQQVVRGYLDAMLAFPASSGTASAFLTPDAAKGWNSLSGVTVYTQPEVSSAASSPGSDGARSGMDGAVQGSSGLPVDVRLNIVEDARLDRQGHYTRRGEATTMSYRLEQVDGEWRIANPQQGSLVNRKFFSDYFRPFDIFFFDKPGRRLVPDPVHLAVGDQLSTALVTSLARGPRSDARGVQRSYVPGLENLRPSVPVSRNGVADVAFDTEFRGLGETARDHLSAQVIWTLRQVPKVTAVTVAGGSTSLSGGSGSPQPIDSWGAFGPSIARGRAYAISADKVVEIDGDDIAPIDGVWGRDARGATAVAVDDDKVAAVLAGRSQVRVSGRDGGSVRTIDGSGFITPRWDDDKGLWIVDRPGDSTRVRRATTTAAPTLDIGSLASLNVRVFALSPDGTRYAVSTRSGERWRLYFGSVLRDAKDKVLGLGEPQALFTTASEPRSVTWTSGTTVGFLADSESGVQVYDAAIDGTVTTGGMSGGNALLPDVGATSLAIGTGSAPTLYATDARRRLWNLAPGGSWKLLDITGVTGLTYGN